MPEGDGKECTGWSPNTRRDNLDDFEIPSSCTGELLIRKEITPLFDVGDTIDVTITIENFDESLTDAVLIDEIPKGTVLINPSEQIESDGERIEYAIDQLEVGESLDLSYQLLTSDLLHASFSLYDDLEGTQFFEKTTSSTGVNDWRLTTSRSSSGIFALAIAPDSVGGEAYATYGKEISITDEFYLLKV